MGNGRHIETTRSDVGGHQYLDMAFAQRHQAAVAYALVQRAMQCHGTETVLLQIVGQGITFDLGTGKNNRLVDRGVAQPVVQKFALMLSVVGPKQHLFDILVFVLRVVDLHPLGLPHHAGGQLLDAGRQRGAEHHGLLAFDGELVDFGQIIGKAQIQHAVGFVNHQKLHLVELDLHRALQVQQTPGRGHHQIGVLQLGDLELVRHATDHIGNTQATAMAYQVDGVMCYLLRELACRAQDQRAWCRSLEVAAAGRVFATRTFGCCFAPGLGFGAGALEIFTFPGRGICLLLEQGVQNRQQERRCFAAASLTRNHQVGKFCGLCIIRQALHRHRNCLFLNDSWLGEAQVLDCLQQLGGQSHLQEAVGHFGFACKWQVIRQNDLGRLRELSSSAADCVPGMVGECGFSRR